jgi:hypothetical protein
MTALSPVPGQEAGDVTKCHTRGECFAGLITFVRDPRERLDRDRGRRNGWGGNTALYIYMMTLIEPRGVPPVAPGSSQEPRELFALADDRDAVVADGKSSVAIQLGFTRFPMSVFNAPLKPQRPSNALELHSLGTGPLGNRHELRPTSGPNYAKGAFPAFFCWTPG